MGTLYVVGNGFDLHHRLPTSLAGFRNYTKYSAFGRLYENGVFMMSATQDLEEHWKNLEENLANLDVDELIEQKIEYYDDDPHENQFLYEVETAIDEMTSGLTQELSNYLIKAENEGVSADRQLRLDANARFINFNYTDTLERIYAIPSENICYIHGKLNSQADIVVGHAMKDSGYEPKPIVDMSTWSEEAQEAYEESHSPDYESALENAHSYFKRSYKDSDACLAYASDFFKSLCDIDSVIILGHSLSKIDFVYFEYINQLVGNKCRWWATYYPDYEKERIYDCLEMIVGDKARVNVLEMLQLKL
jgi:hypothetical protein